jgi:hypothetical protein
MRNAKQVNEDATLSPFSSEEVWMNQTNVKLYEMVECGDLEGIISLLYKRENEDDFDCL